MFHLSFTSISFANILHELDKLILNLYGVTVMKIFKTISSILAAIALTTLIGCASTTKKESTGEYIDDSLITTKVKTAVLNEPTLKSSEINVETFKGVVQLSGFVNSQADIQKAAEVAGSVKGVISVKNDMHLKAQ